MINSNRTRHAAQTTATSIIIIRIIIIINNQQQNIEHKHNKQPEMSKEALNWVTWQQTTARLHLSFLIDCCCDCHCCWLLVVGCCCWLLLLVIDDCRCYCWLIAVIVDCRLQSLLLWLLLSSTQIKLKISNAWRTN